MVCMIGFSSMLLELSLPLFATAMLAALALHACRRPTWRNWAGVGIILIFTGLVDTRLYFQLQNRAELRSLSPIGIRRVYVAGKWRKDPQVIAAVVAALRQSDWFSANHGGWRQRQWLILEYESGRQFRLLVAPYHRESGAVISFGRPPSGGGFHDGYAFSRTLPAALAGFGYQLEGQVQPPSVSR